MNDKYSYTYQNSTTIECESEEERNIVKYMDTTFGQKPTQEEIEKIRDFLKWEGSGIIETITITKRVEGSWIEP